MTQGIVRVGDKIEGKCNSHTVPKNVKGVWKTGSGISSCDGKAIVRVGDKGEADCGHEFIGVSGSSVSFTEGKAIMRVGDKVDIQGGEGVCISGSGLSVSN